MKRSPLTRKTPLRQRALETKAPRKPVRAVARTPGDTSTVEPGRDAWKLRRYGRCFVCGAYGPVVLHHVVRESDVRRAGGDPWDQRNAVPLGAPAAFGGVCCCHDDHHAVGISDRRIAAATLPASARAFAVELFGADAADLYFGRRYR